jgi:hypothetical protein
VPTDKETVSQKEPASEVVNDFHRYSDVDSRMESQHHTLGNRPTQSARGDHNHRDNNGTPLLSDVVLTGSTTTNTASVLSQVCAALELLGALDNTT